MSKGISLLESKDTVSLPQKFGELLSEAQRLFDLFAMPICPDQLQAPVLHKVLQLPEIQPFIFGGKVCVRCVPRTIVIAC
ncbi:MAG TPA: hypothetical protein V6C97_00695 [Oculatellaceae cyanobacterium]